MNSSYRTPAPARVIVTCAPPNPNGDLHLGHLSGPFLGGDVLRRYLRQTGREVAYVSYADDYSCYVERRAEELAETPARTAHAFGRRMEQTLSLAGMLPDFFNHPLREPGHAEVVRQSFTRLWSRDAFEVATLPAFWCTNCERFLYEAEVRGRCQFCAAASDGFYCEECGRPQESAGLAEPHCTRCRQAPVTRDLSRIVLPLERYRGQLQAYYADRPLRPRLREYLDDMFSRPLPATTVSRRADYGVPVPLPDWEGHVLDTWYSGIWGYVAATRALADATGDPDSGIPAWRDSGTSIVHFIGFDCSFSHALLWPALFLAHGELRLPEHVITNEFYRLEGEKFSTSRGHAVWGGDLLGRMPADPVRFFLCLTGPEQEQTSFSAKEFAAVVNGVLVNQLQDWLDMLLGLVWLDLDGRAPATDPDGPPDLVALNRRLSADLADALEPAHFSPRRAAGLLHETIGAVAADLPRLRAARGDGVGYQAQLALHLELMARLAAGCGPIMPATAAQLWTALGLPLAGSLVPTVPWPDGAARLVRGGSRVTAPPTLFQPVKL